MTDLANKSCVPCRGGVATLAGADLAVLAAAVPRWQVVDAHHLERQFAFSDFAGALAWVNRIGAEAEAQGHHPDLCLAWGRVGVKIWTHAVDGLTESDFILAARIDRLEAEGPE